MYQRQLKDKMVLEIDNIIVWYSYYNKVDQFNVILSQTLADVMYVGWSMKLCK
jgi:hypothetical protein